MVRIIGFWVLVLGIFIGGVKAQAIEPSGYIVEDSIQIGMPFSYSLTVRYPDHIDILFPDSTFNFGSFEYVRKEVFPTYRDSTTLVDSAIYYLRTFEIDKVQGLTLPIFLLKKGDSIRVNAAPDSAHLIEMIPALTAQERPKSSTKYEKVEKAFNYPYLIILLVFLTVLAVVIMLIFGKRIRQYFKSQKLRKQYITFSDAFGDDISALTRTHDLRIAEETLFKWKVYLEKLEKRPYAKLTTKEIQSFDLGETVTGALRLIDRSIYKGYFDDDLIKGFHTLEDVAAERYSMELDKIKNA